MDTHHYLYYLFLANQAAHPLPRHCYEAIRSALLAVWLKNHPPTDSQSHDT